MNGDLTVTLCSSMATPTSPCPTTGTYCATDDPVGCLVQVRLTYRSDIVVPFMGALLPHDANGRFVQHATTTMVVELMRRAAPRGQMLVIFAVLLVVLLGFAGVAIDVGRVTAERRHVQAAVDAGALAACRALIAGETDTAAATAAQQVTLTNLQNSPAGATATIASPPSYEDLDGSGAIDADELVSGIVDRRDDGPRRRRLDGRHDARPGRRHHDARHRSAARAATSRVARQSRSSPVATPTRQEPGSGFVDHLATAASSGSGVVDTVEPARVRRPHAGQRGGPRPAVHDLRSEQQGPQRLELPRLHRARRPKLREHRPAASYYNGVTPGMNPNTLKDVEGAYLVTGYPGPAFPPVSTPPNGTTQVAVLSGNDTSFVPSQFNDTFRVGDRLMLAVYDSTVMEIPDFAISPPVEIALPATTVTPYDGPTTTISRNDDFHSTVTLSLRGDAGRGRGGTPGVRHPSRPVRHAARRRRHDRADLVD